MNEVLSDKLLKSVFTNFPGKEKFSLLSVCRRWRNLTLELINQECSQELSTFYDEINKIFQRDFSMPFSGRKEIDQIIASPLSSLEDFVDRNIRITRVFVDQFIGIEEEKFENLRAPYVMFQAAYTWKQLHEHWSSDQHELKEHLLRLVEVYEYFLMLEKIHLLKDEKAKEECIFAMLKQCGNNGMILKKISEHFIKSKEEKWLLHIFRKNEKALDIYLKEKGCLETLKTYFNPDLFQTKIDWDKIFEEISQRIPKKEVKPMIEWMGEQGFSLKYEINVIQRLLNLEMYKHANHLLVKIAKSHSIKNIPQLDGNKKRGFLDHFFHVLTLVLKSLLNLKQYESVVKFLVKIAECFSIEIDRNRRKEFLDHIYLMLKTIVQENESTGDDLFEGVAPFLCKKYCEIKHFVLADEVAGCIPSSFCRHTSFLEKQSIFYKLLEEDDIDLIFDFLGQIKNTIDYSFRLEDLFYQLVDEKKFFLAADLANYEVRNLEYKIQFVFKKCVEEIEDISVIKELVLRIKNSEERSRVYLQVAKLYADQSAHEKAKVFADLYRLENV